MPRHFKNQFDLCTTACVRSKTKRHVFCRPYRGRHVSFSLYRNNLTQLTGDLTTPITPTWKLHGATS